MFFASNNPAEASLRTSQDSLIKFIDSIEEGFELLELIFDKQGNVEDFVFLKVNPAYEKQTGLKAANIIGKRKKEVAPASEQRWYDYAVKAVKTAKTLSYEYYNDKVNRYFDAEFIPISTNKIAVTFKDITERKKAEEALKESEDRYHSLFSNMDEAFALHEILYDSRGTPTDYRFLEVNVGFERQTGLRASEIIGKTVYEVLPDLEPFWIETYSKVVATGEPIRFENFSRSLKRYYEVYAYRPVQGRFAVIFTDITERKKTEEALKLSEIKYRTVADFTYDWEHWISPDGKLIYVSPSCMRITGYKPEEFIEDKDLIIKIIHPDDKALVESHYKSIDSKELSAFDHRIITKSGEIRWIAHACQPVFDGKGKWLGRRGSNRDITERKKAERALLESEEKYKQLVDRLPEMVFEIDLTGHVVFANLRAIELTGYSKEEFALDFDANRLVDVEDAKRSGENMKKMFATGIRQTSEYVFVKRDGAHFPVLLISVPILRENKIIGARGIGVDITELKQMQHSLKESEERYRQLFSSITEMFFVAELLNDETGKTVDFVYTEANPAFVNSLGKRSEQVVGKRAKELFGGVGIEDFWLEELSNVNKTGKAFHAERPSKRTGKIYDVYVWSINENLAGVIFEDITQRKTLEKQLQDSERLAAIGATAGMVGHDIRNPLQAITSDLFLAKTELAALQENEQKANALESLDAIEENIDYINKIVSDLQDYARPLKADYKDVNVEDLLVKVFERVVIPDNIKLKFSVKGTVRFKTDATFMQRALTNLVNNAIQSMPDGGELGLTAYKEENGVVISVSDTGKGIPEDVKPNLFTPLTTTKAKGSRLRIGSSEEIS